MPQERLTADIRAENRSQYSTTPAMRTFLFLQTILLPSFPVHLHTSATPKAGLIHAAIQFYDASAFTHTALLPLQNSVYQCCLQEKTLYDDKTASELKMHHNVSIPPFKSGLSHNLSTTISQLLQSLFGGLNC